MRVLRLIILSGLALFGTGQLSQAQNCGGGCGPTVKNSAVTRSGHDCGHFGLMPNPRSELHYIKQFCGPHIVPGSCFGYFKPTITPWGDACPLYGDSRVDAAMSGQRSFTPAATPTETEPTKPANTPANTNAPKTLPEPKVVPKTPETGTPMKPPTVSPIVPKLNSSTLPSIPSVPVVLPPIPETPTKY
jgi:hypothetical protein